jgi:hypothetical protein
VVLLVGGSEWECQQSDGAVSLKKLVGQVDVGLQSGAPHLRGSLGEHFEKPVGLIGISFVELGNGISRNSHSDV